MFKIIEKKVLNNTVSLMKIKAPIIANKAKPGQFLILRVDKDGERIPLTIADYNKENGTVTIIFQIVGATTKQLNCLNEIKFFYLLFEKRKTTIHIFYYLSFHLLFLSLSSKLKILNSFFH